MKYYKIKQITDCSNKYGSFLNKYTLNDEYYKFMEIGQPFEGFSSQPIIFERDKSYKNDEPVSDFLLSNWSEIIVSERIYKMLKGKYSNEMEFYKCFAMDEGILKPYYILRAKYEIDVLDRKNSVMGGILGRAIKTVINDSIPININFFYVKDGYPNVISKQLYDDLKALNPTNFEVTPVATASEEIKARERIKKRKEKAKNMEENSK